MTSSLDRLHDLGDLGPERPPTRPRALLTFVVPLLVAALFGAAVGLDPLTVLLLAVGAAGAVAMVLRLEWAVHVVVAAACFDDWLGLASPGAVKALAVLLVAAWLLRRAWGPLHRGGRRPVLVVAGLLVVALLLATAVHTNGAVGLEVLVRYGGFLAVLLVVADAISDGMDPRSVARTFVWSAAAAGACGIVVLLASSPDDRRVAGPVGDANDFALLLLAAIPLVPALRAATSRTLRYDLALGVLVLATLGTLSRGALVGLVVMFVAAVLLRVLSVRGAVVSLVAAATMGAIVVAVIPQTVDVMLDRKSAVAAENVDERLELWDTASDMTVANPVLGLGPGGFRLYQDDYRGNLPVDATADLDVAHNTYLEISAETGVVGLAVWLALLLAGVAAAWSRWRADRTPLAGGVLVGLIGLAVTAAFVTAQYALPIWLLLALAAGLGLRGGRVDDLLRKSG